MVLVTLFLMLIGYLYVFHDETTCSNLLLIFLLELFPFLMLFEEVFVYFGYKCFIRHVFCKYFSPGWWDLFSFC